MAQAYSCVIVFGGLPCVFVQLYSTSRFLLARPENHTFVEHLLDTINNIVQYQYEGNGHLVYALVRRRKAVETVRVGCAGIVLTA